MYILCINFVNVKLSLGSLITMFNLDILGMQWSADLLYFPIKKYNHGIP